MKYLTLLFVALVSACGQRQPEPDRWASMTAHGCTLESRVDSGERVYCGKACSQPVIVRTYSCPATKWSFRE